MKVADYLLFAMHLQVASVMLSLLSVLLLSIPLSLFMFDDADGDWFALDWNT